MTAVALGEVADFINGFAFKPDDWHEDGLPIIRIQNLTDPSKPINYSNRDVPDKFHARKGDLLVSWSATLGVFTWDRTDRALVNQHIFRVVPSDKIEQAFLRHMLIGALESMQRHLHGATMQHVNRGEFLSTEIPLPPISEQRRIAAILDHADALRAMRRQVLAHLNDLTQSIFYDMVPASGAGSVPLGEVVTSIDSGTSPKCEARPATPDEWGVLKLGAVTYGIFDEAENKAFLQDVGSMVKNEVRAGDVLMTRKNTRELVGAVALVEDGVRERLLLPDLIFRLRLDVDQLHPRFFHGLMSTRAMRDAVRNLSSGSAASMPNISKTRLRDLSLNLPDMTVQTEFARRIASMDALRRRVLQARAVEDELFASLQFRAFRGEL